MTLTVRQIKEMLIYSLFLIAVTLLIVGMTSLYQAADTAAFGEHGHNIVTLYDDGSIRVIERAGDVLCYRNGRGTDCISRGLKSR